MTDSVSNTHMKLIDKHIEGMQNSINAFKNNLKSVVS